MNNTEVVRDTGQESQVSPMDEPQPEYIQFANLEIENNAELQNYYRNNKLEIEHSEALVVNQIIDYFNKNYFVEIHPEKIPEACNDRLRLIDGSLHPIIGGMDMDEKESLCRLKDELVKITGTSVQLTSWSRGYIIEEIIQNFWKDNNDSEQLLNQEFAQLGPNIKSNISNIAFNLLTEIINQNDLEIGMQILHSLMADAYDVSPEEAKNIPIFWVHGMPIENAVGVAESGFLSSQRELIFDKGKANALSGASLSKKGSMTNGVKFRYLTEIYGNIERDYSLYTGYVPEARFKTATEASEWVKSHRDSEDYLCDDQGDFNQRKYLLSFEALDETSIDTEWIVKAQQAWDCYFFKPIQMILEEAKVKSSLLVDNNRGSGIAIDRKISVQGGRFLVRTQVASDYLLAKGVPADKIFLAKNTDRMFMINNLYERLGNKPGKKMVPRRKLEEYNSI